MSADLLYQETLKKCAGGILLLDSQRRVKFINTWLINALALDAYEGDDVECPLLQLIPQAENLRFLKAIQAALEKGVSSKLSATFEPNLLQLKDPSSGVPLSHSTNISAVQVADETFCLINVIDETKPLKREKLLSDYIQKLKDTELELEKSRDAAIQASHVKTEFIASVSHQLRTPLNAIVGFSELLANGALGDLNEEQQESVKDIFSAGKLLSDFVTQILFITDCSTNSETELEPVSVMAELHVIVEQIMLETPFSQLRMHCDGESDAVISVNRRVLQALLKNVVSVAVSCQQNDVKISAKEEMENQWVLSFDGDWLTGKLALDTQSGLVKQVSEQAINTQGDMRFYLDLSHQLAELAGIKLDYREGVGLRLIFSTDHIS